MTWSVPENSSIIDHRHRGLQPHEISDMFSHGKRRVIKTRIMMRLVVGV
jgi:hypothetical protein